MGKRPYYVIYYTTEYDGYNTVIKYVGNNFQAAKARYRALYDYVYQHLFLDEGVHEDDICTEFRPVPENMQPGQQIGSYINDQNEMWDSVNIVCLNSGSFVSPREEEEYKNNYPNAKY